jgi:hypothetical protein
MRWMVVSSGMRDLCIAGVRTFYRKRLLVCDMIMDVNGTLIPLHLLHCLVRLTLKMKSD